MMMNSSTSLGVPPFQGKRMGVDWAELPQEIIELISKRITIYSDYLRFLRVCRSWNSYIPETPLHILPPKLPWLMLSHNSFFDPSTKEIHHLNLPLSSSHKSRICCSSFGWLVILHDISKVRLLNPITCVTLSLPSLYTLPKFVRKPLKSNCNQFLHKIVLSSSPSLSDDFAALAILNFGALAFCRKGYDSWVLLRMNAFHEWMDVVCNNGLFYAVSTKGVIAVCDVKGPRVSIIETTNFVYSLKEMYDVVFSREDMLLVSSCLLKKDVCQGMWIRILRMNWNALMWEEVQSLGRVMLFVGWRSSLSISAADFVGCNPNDMYFTNDDHIGIYSVCNKSIKLLLHYPLNLDRPLECPIWFTPNPR